MTRRPSMQFYTSDWLGGTALMSCTARGAYITMLAVSWEQGPIPDTRTALFKSMGLGPDDPPLDQVWAEVQPKWTLTDRGWTNAKLETVRAARDAYCKSQAAKGRKGGRPPKAGGKPELSGSKPEGYEKLKAGGKPKKTSPTPISDLQIRIQRRIRRQLQSVQSRRARDLFTGTTFRSQMRTPTKPTTASRRSWPEEARSGFPCSGSSSSVNSSRRCRT